MSKIFNFLMGSLVIIFNFLMGSLVIVVTKWLGYTPDEVLEMYERVENGLPVFKE